VTIRATKLGKLARTKEAKVYINEGLQIKLEYAKHPKEYIKSYLSLKNTWK
jgi:hypothetical protein